MLGNQLPLFRSPCNSPVLLQKDISVLHFLPVLRFHSFVRRLSVLLSSVISVTLFQAVPAQYRLCRNRRSEESVKFEYSLTMSESCNKTSKHAETQLFVRVIPSPLGLAQFTRAREFTGSSRRRLHDLRDSSWCFNLCLSRLIAL